MSAPKSPNGPVPPIGRIFVAGSTRPAGSSATVAGAASIAAAIWSAGRHAAVLASTGALTSTPHGNVRWPVLASAVSSATVVALLRFVTPVTTASGKDDGSATPLGLGFADGRGPESVG